MANLFWKMKTRTRRLLATPFRTEEEFEKTVFDTSELLEDIFLLRRQVRGGRKPGIPDIVGVDSDGNVCIIEMKNTTVDASIVPQVLEYAFWAEGNPDSIKVLWSDCENKPDDLTISWDDFQVRILIIAPSILPSTLDIVDKINYAVDLIEVKRWVEGTNELLLVNKLEQEQKKAKMRTRTTKGLPVNDEAFYKSQYNKSSAEHFLRYVDELEREVKKRNWPLQRKFNKHYCGFKAGAFIAFGVVWVGSRTFAFFFKVTESEARRFRPKMTKYISMFKEARYYIDPDKTKTRDFLPLLTFAQKKLTGG